MFCRLTYFKWFVLRFGMLYCLCFCTESALAASDDDLLDCRFPSRSASLASLSHCIMGKSVTLMLTDGSFIAGKLLFDDKAGCKDIEKCTLRISKRFRRYRVNPDSIKSVTYRPSPTRDRKIIGWAVGVGTALAIIVPLAKDSEGAWIGIVPTVGIISTGAGVLSTRQKKITVQVHIARSNDSREP